jgi:hypothetical protein
MIRLSGAVCAAILTACLVATAITGYAIGTAQQTPADITVMPCTAWDNDAHPTIPANTLTDTCVDTTGTLHTAPTSREATR